MPDDEVFKICLEFYHHFSQDLYQASRSTATFVFYVSVTALVFSVFCFVCLLLRFGFDLCRVIVFGLFGVSLFFVSCFFFLVSMRPWLPFVPVRFFFVCVIGRRHV